MRERRPATSTDPVTEYESFEHFLSGDDVPKGRFVVPYEGVPVDFFYQPVPGATTTVLFFHGSTQRDVDLPMHLGKGMMRGTPANHLTISDPSLTLDDSKTLILSWYAGSSRQPELQHFLRSVVQLVLERTGNPHLIFLGGSGGGFASLEMSRHFPGSLALVMNPQTVLPNYHAHLVRRYLDLCWDGAPALSDLPAHIATNLADVYQEPIAHTIAYIQNTRDDHHLENHQLPFLEKVGYDRNVFMMMDAWGEPTGRGHVRPPAELVKSILQQLVAGAGRWRRTLVDAGFNHHTDPQTVLRTVRRANAGLPKKLVADTM